MCFINVGCNNKSMLSFCKTHCSFITHLICYFRRDLSRLKRLTDLICNNIPFGFSARPFKIFFFRLRKFFISQLCITGIGRNIFSLIRLFFIHCIIRPFLQTLRYGLSFICMHYDQSCCRHFCHPP